MKRHYITPEIEVQTITPLQMLSVSWARGDQYTQEDYDLEEEEELLAEETVNALI